MQREQVPQKARVSQRDVPALYDKLAWLYDVWGHLTESRARHRALELAAIEPGSHVLEVAVGTGLAFVHVVKTNPNGRNVRTPDLGERLGLGSLVLIVWALGVARFGE